MNNLTLAVYFLAICCVSSCTRTPQTVSTIPIATPIATPAPERISFVPEQVALNYTTKQMEITGTLRFRRESGEMKPGKVWIWAYFFAPGSTDGSWSDKPIGLELPFLKADEVKITAKGHFHFHDNPYVPESGIYARVKASAASEEDAQTNPPARNKMAAGAIPVSLLARR